MARPFNTTDAKRIIERHQNIIEKMNSAVSSVERYRAKAKEASDALVAQEVLRVLADIPIEEINRDKRGIRVKATCIILISLFNSYKHQFGSITPFSHIRKLRIWVI